MSKSTIARWNAIPMDRVEPLAGTKRSRDNSSDEDEEDNVSLVSRTPSPEPGANEALRGRVSQYAASGYMEEEIATLETRIKKTNIGYSLLSKLGWREGEGLGAHGTGRPDPIPFVLKNDQMGLGKATLDYAMIDATVSQRRDLESERQTRETDEQRQAREDSVAKQAAIRTEITDVLKPFYCRLCDKQYVNVAQYDEHCNSYAHHHKVREKDLNASRKVGQESSSARAEKERKREAKELKKMAKAQGIKMPSLSTSTSSSSTLLAPAPIVPADASAKKGGWATVGSVGTSKTGGWNKVGVPTPTLAPAAPIDSDPVPPPPAGAPPPPPPPPSDVPPPPPPSDTPPPPPPPVSGGHGGPKNTPRFQSAGWVNLTHQLEEKAVVDSNEDVEGDDIAMAAPASQPGSPSGMAVDVDTVWPATPGVPLRRNQADSASYPTTPGLLGSSSQFPKTPFDPSRFGGHAPHTPGWRMHGAPSPSPRFGASDTLDGEPAVRNGGPGDPAAGGYFSPLSALRGVMRGRGRGRGRGNGARGDDGGWEALRGESAYSPPADLRGPPGWERNR